MNFQHEPVLLQETLQWMNVQKNGVYCDGTLGGGGHSEAILRASDGTAVLYGIDRDETAIRAATERLRCFSGFHAIQGNFHDGKELLREAGADAQFPLGEPSEIANALDAITNRHANDLPFVDGNIIA